MTLNVTFLLSTNITLFLKKLLVLLEPNNTHKKIKLPILLIAGFIENA